MELEKIIDGWHPFGIRIACCLADSYFNCRTGFLRTE
jgi:hypothetical protein